MDIVIYEQDDLTQALLREWLGRAGYLVRSAAPCAAALALGVQQVIAKPLLRADLVRAVRGMIGVPN